MPDGGRWSPPIIPVVIGDDWQAVLFWKALYDAGVYTNVALYPAVPRGGALLRTSVMATHEHEHLDRAHWPAVRAGERGGGGVARCCSTSAAGGGPRSPQPAARASQAGGRSGGRGRLPS